MNEVLRSGSTAPPREWRPWIRCHECGEIAESEANIADSYLLGQAGACPLCRANLDYWRVAVLMVNNRDFPTPGSPTTATICPLPLRATSSAS